MSKRKKKFIIVFAGITSLIVLLLGIILFDYLEEDSDKNHREDFNLYFYAPNYEFNILEDPEYIELNRVISYKFGAVTKTVLPENYSAIDPLLPFISSLLDTMIAGNYDAYANFFSTNFKKENELPKKFTMQRIYNVTIEKISDPDTEHGYLYMIDFMISKNDGTLRNDVESDASKPWYVSIITENGEYKIDKIVTVN